MATPNRNSSPTYRWATPFTRLRKENSFGKFVKTFRLTKHFRQIYPWFIINFENKAFNTFYSSIALLNSLIL
ncbi:hypothetical protein F8165_29540 [Bacillus cereus]|uniref:Uncharacterized protein n=1 Tax=Bacillus cereus TaxID=1396 RepID=A0AAN5XJQ0_BACCE|nr:hypothetical protein F8165_29540 [Bacillus cereus]